MGPLCGGRVDRGGTGRCPLHVPATLHRLGPHPGFCEGMSVLEAEAALLSEPHHDGSDVYVLERPDELGGEAVVRVRAPGEVDAVALRYTEDGEARAVEAQSDGEGWWVARFPVRNPTVRYRWLLSGGELGYAWLNGLGVVDHDIPDADDFVRSEEHTSELQSHHDLVCRLLLEKKKKKKKKNSITKKKKKKKKNKK